MRLTKRTWFGYPKLRNPQNVADAEKWCASYHGRPSRRARITSIEIAALLKRCGLEGR